MRPATIGAFSLGLAAGSLFVAAAAAFSTTGAEQLPACETSMHYVVAVR